MWIKLVLSMLPTERIVAACFDYLLRKIEKKNTPELAKSVQRIIESSVAFQECANNPDKAKAAKAAIQAWAKSRPTPNVYKELKK